MLWAAVLAVVSLPLAARADDPTPPAQVEAAAPAAEGAAPTAPSEWWNIHFVSTVAIQYHPAFHAPYSGQNSMQPYAETATAFISTLGLDVRLWKGADIVFNPEVSGGYGLSQTLGIAAFPSGLVYRVGNPAPAIYLADLYLRQAIGLGGGTEDVESGMHELAGPRDKNRLTFIIGRINVEDFFDGNAYAHDATTQFFDWALFASGAWDYPADTRGYTYGAIADLTMNWWSARAGIALEPLYANLETMDWDIAKARGLMAEFEARWTAFGGPGAVRITPFFNTARMGSYAQVLADPAAYGGQVQPTRAEGRTKYGVAMSADQQLTPTVGIFLRASINDGANESWAFTEIDRSLAVGVVKDGSLWGWRPYEVGGAFVINGLSGLHRAYLAQGGYGFIIGDGHLSYAPEILGDFYFRVEVSKWLQASVIYQPVFDPGYNSARGPINIFSLRVRVAF
ncbi:MAG: carbohydrate porin [Myxococcaceae bacterium]